MPKPRQAAPQNHAQNAEFFVANAAAAPMLSACMDVNLWGEFVVPVGILICFGPALIAWALMGFGAKKEKEDKH